MLITVIKRLVFVIVIANLIASQAQIIGGIYTTFCNFVRLPAYCPNTFDSISFPPIAFAQTPSSATSPFTFPTIYTTNRPGSPAQTTPANRPTVQPGQVAQQISQIPPFCPPFLSICPAGIITPILQIPNIDPRLIVRQVNGCPCIDSRSPILTQPIIGAGQSSPSIIPILPSGASFPNVPFTQNQAVPSFPNFGATPALGQLGNPSVQPFPSVPNTLPGAFPSFPSSAIIPSQFVNGFPPFPSASFPATLPPNILLRSGDQIRA